MQSCLLVASTNVACSVSAALCEGLGKRAVPAKRYNRACGHGWVRGDGRWARPGARGCMAGAGAGALGTSGCLVRVERRTGKARRRHSEVEAAHLMFERGARAPQALQW